MAAKLCPAQQRAYETLTLGLAPGILYVVSGGTGSGKSTVLREVQRTWGGRRFGMKAFVEALRGRDPLSLEETFYDLVLEALSAHATVIVDDLHLLTGVVMGRCFGYPRPGLLAGPLTALASYASDEGKRLVFASEGGAPGLIHQRCQYSSIGEFRPEDYAALCQIFLGE